MAHKFDLQLRGLTKKVSYTLLNNVITTASVFLTIAMFISYLKIGAADFQFFWDAGTRVHLGKSAYENGIRLSYFNGPSFAIILSGFQMFSLSVAAIIWKSGIVLSAILIALFIFRYYLDKLNVRNSSMVLCLLLCTFPFRNNLANAQVVVLLTLLLLITFRNILLNNSLVLTTFCIFFSFELKPYLVVLILAFLLLDRKFKYIYSTSVGFVLANLIYLAFHQNLSYFDWYKSMRFRGSGNFSTIDQSTLLSILKNGFGVSETLSKIIYGLFFILILWVSLRVFLRSYNNFRYLIPLSLGPILFYFSHEQDYFVSVVALILIIVGLKGFHSNNLIFLVIGLGLNWTNGNLGLGLLVLTVIISSVALNLSKVNLWWFKLLCVLLGSFFSLVIPAILFRFFGSDIQYFWHNAIAFIFGFLIWFILIEALREKQNMINKLK